MGASLPLWVPIAAALVAAAGVLVAAAVTAVATGRRERDARRAEAESLRLAELADAALDLWRATDSATGGVVDVARAEGVFVVRAEAVASATVREAAAPWHRLLREADASEHWPALLELLREIGRARRDAL